LLLAPAGTLVAAAFAGEPLLAHRTQTFMGNAARFVAQFFPLLLLGALFAKPMGDSGSVAAVADWMTRRLGAAVTCGGVSLFVAYFVPAPTAATLFRAAGLPRRLMPAAILVGSSAFTMSAVHGTPVIPNIIPAAFFGTTPFAAPSLGLIATAVMPDLGLRWLARGGGGARLHTRRQPSDGAGRPGAGAPRSYQRGEQPARPPRRVRRSAGPADRGA
jgi:H+/gluconate symporter-like permease